MTAAQRLRHAGTWLLLGPVALIALAILIIARPTAPTAEPEGTIFRIGPAHEANPASEPAP